MRKLFFAGAALAAGVALATACATPLRAQGAGASASASGGKMPAAGSAQDLAGVWLFAGGGDTFDLPRDAPFTPAAKAKFESERSQHGPNVVLDYESNTDPFIRRCDPLGVPRVLLANHPYKIVPLAAEVIVLYERSHDFREIYTDGREHPKDIDPSWWGHSIGKWDASGALTVDSVGFNDKTWLDYQGLPHSEALHVIERYRRTGHDNLELQLTIEDPKDYTRSWSVTRNYQRKAWDIGEEICTVESEDHFNSGIVHPASVPKGK